MPYLKKETKNLLDDGDIPVTPGELNYAFTSIIKQYLSQNGMSYQSLNDVVGALECCKLEAYRRVVVPYEETKIKTNGDVY